MPYVGVRTVLGRQGIGLPARVQDRFVNELGVETAFDLAELTEADLTSVGVGSSYARLRAELSRKFGANLEGAPQELSSGVLCELSAAAIEWHDERHKGTRPIHAATGAPSNFSGLLDYVVGAGGCGVDIVGLSVDGT